MQAILKLLIKYKILKQRFLYAVYTALILIHQYHNIEKIQLNHEGHITFQGFFVLYCIVFVFFFLYYYYYLLFLKQILGEGHKFND